MKNLKGGYQLIDLQGNDLSSGFTLEGLHQVITLSNNKPLLVTGIVISGVKKNDVYTTAEKSGDDYVFTIYGKTLTVEEDDDVTVANESLGTTLYQHKIYNSADTGKSHLLTAINTDPTPIEITYQYGSYTAKYNGTQVTLAQYFKRDSVISKISDSGKGYTSTNVIDINGAKIYCAYITGGAITLDEYEFFGSTRTYEDIVTKL